jgi:hypothetical protein
MVPEVLPGRNRALAEGGPKSIRTEQCAKGGGSTVDSNEYLTRDEFERIEANRSAVEFQSERCYPLAGTTV